MKATQYKTGLDPQNIAYYFNKDEIKSNNSKLRSATTSPKPIIIPAVFKAGHMRFKDVL